MRVFSEAELYEVRIEKRRSSNSEWSVLCHRPVGTYAYTLSSVRCGHATYGMWPPSVRGKT